jgi:hypothetical protein
MVSSISALRAFAYETSVPTVAKPARRRTLSDPIGRSTTPATDTLHVWLRPD